MKKLLVILSLAVFGVALVGCGSTETTTTTSAATTTTTKTPIIVQGITDTSIKIGNSAAISGGYSVIGIPFVDGMKAVFKQVNDAGGIDGRLIEFITYDDGFDAATGKTNIEKLINEDEIFAIVGHFGTPTVGATLDIIQEVGIPMVYAATGINALYFQESVGNPVMAVQPIYMTDGRMMAARAVKTEIYGTAGNEALPAGAKIGVIYTNDDVGSSIKAGIELEATALGMSSNFIYQAVTAGSFNTAVTIFKASGVSAVILAMNQEPFAYALTSMSNLSLNVPVFTSYVNADVTAVDQLRYNAARPIYTNAWLDNTSAQGQIDAGVYIACIAQADLDEATKAGYYFNNFALAGYIAATVFVEGLQRVADSDVELTWANYIAAMEDGAIEIPLGGVVDFSDGHRWGIASMSLLEYTIIPGDNPLTTTVVETEYEAFLKVEEIQTIEQVEGN